MEPKAASARGQPGCKTWARPSHEARGSLRRWSHSGSSTRPRKLYGSENSPTRKQLQPRTRKCCNISAQVAYSVGAIGHHHLITPLVASVAGSRRGYRSLLHNLGQSRANVASTWLEPLPFVSHCTFFMHIERFQSVGSSSSNCHTLDILLEVS
ncbi:hypothetical protein LY78DRAFT_173290 [Colletotrichum sublineola]|nr:hypothetical protein LY78DRAFT_173290 [Colletotrichum sublineola]